MKNKKLLGFDLDDLLHESLEHLFEVAEDESTSNMKEKLAQEEAKAKSTKRKKIYAKKSDDESSGDEGVEIAPEKPAKIKHEKLPDINVKSIRTKIDNIRAGKSLKDKETMNSLKGYFEKLNGPERIALFAFLAGLEKILGDAAKDVKTPHANPFNIDMEKDKEVETNREPKSKPRGTKHISSDKEAETPIVVGEMADTTSIKSKLWRK